MLAIRLVVDPVEADVLALPVRRVAPEAEEGSKAILAPIVGVPEAVTDEAGALLPLLDRAGEAGNVRLQLRPSGAPTRLLLFGVGDGDEPGWRAAGAGLARSINDENSITIVMPTDVEPAAVRGLAEGLWLASYRFRMSGEPATDQGPAEVRVVVDDPA
ncbi:MAG TPA: M17 family peptidase N-terminal domain-containing protein, partial [Micromonospora sp.]